MDYYVYDHVKSQFVQTVRGCSQETAQAVADKLNIEFPIPYNVVPRFDVLPETELQHYNPI